MTETPEGVVVTQDFLAELRRVNAERYAAWVGDQEDAGIMFDATELGGEVGELLNVVKKLEREERGWRGSRAEPDDFADECADVLICLDKLARRRNVDLVAATVRKFNATSEKVGLPHRLAHTHTLRGEEVERLRQIVWRETQSVTWQADEDNAHATRLRMCAERRAQWGEDDCEDRDGSCDECAYDMAEKHETEASRAVRAAGQRILAALSQPLAVDTGQSGEDTPRRTALRAMVAMDEELEAEHPGWMDGATPAPSVSPDRHPGWTEAGHAWLDAGAPIPVSPDRAGEEAVTDREVNALRYLLNWSGTGKKVATVMKTFTLDGETRHYTKDTLESLWRKLSARLASSPIPKTFPREVVERALDNARYKVGHVTIDAMDGDNLAVTLCSHFDDGGEADENGWSKAAVDGCDATLAAVHKVYADAIIALLQEDRQS